MKEKTGKCSEDRRRGGGPLEAYYKNEKEKSSGSCKNPKTKRKSVGRLRQVREGEVGVAIRVNGSCSCRVNVLIVSTFANPNPTYLLFVLGGSTRI